jgi:hypothetical protein
LPVAFSTARTARVISVSRNLHLALGI